MRTHNSSGCLNTLTLSTVVSVLSRYHCKPTSQAPPSQTLSVVNSRRVRSHLLILFQTHRSTVLHFSLWIRLSVRKMDNRSTAGAILYSRNLGSRIASLPPLTHQASSLFLGTPSLQDAIISNGRFMIVSTDKGREGKKNG